MADEKTSTQLTLKGMAGWNKSILPALELCKYTTWINGDTRPRKVKISFSKDECFKH